MLQSTVNRPVRRARRLLAAAVLLLAAQSTHVLAAEDEPPPDVIDPAIEQLGDAYDEAASNPQRLWDQIREIGDVDVGPDGKDRNDLAFWLLTQMFGDFIWNIWLDEGDQMPGGGSTTLLSQMLGAMNIVAFALALVLMGFVLVSALINTAQDGVPLGRDVDTFWMPVRNGLAMILMVPVTGVGGGTMSIAQVLVMWMLIWGSSAGSVLWDQATELASTGGLDLTRQASARQTVSADVAHASNIAMAMTCQAALQRAGHGGPTVMGALQNYWEGSLFGEGEQVTFDSDLDFPPPLPDPAGASGSLTPDSTLAPTTAASTPPPMEDFSQLIASLRDPAARRSEYKFGPYGDCGRLSVPLARDAQPALAGMSASEYCAGRTDSAQGRKACAHARAYEAVEEIVSTGYADLIERLRDAVVVPIVSSDSVQALAQNAIAGAGKATADRSPEEAVAVEGVDLLAGVLGEVVRQNHDARASGVVEGIRSNTEGVQHEWRETMSERGWAYAGMFFLELARAQNELTKARQMTYGEASAPNPTDRCWRAGPGGGREGGIGCENTDLAHPDNDVDAAIFLASAVGGRATALFDAGLGGSLGAGAAYDAPPALEQRESPCSWSTIGLLGVANPGTLNCLSNHAATLVYSVFEWAIGRSAMHDSERGSVYGVTGFLAGEGEPMISPFFTLIELGETLLSLVYFLFGIIIAVFVGGSAASSFGSTLGGGVNPAAWLARGGGEMVGDMLAGVGLTLLAIAIPLGGAGIGMAYVLPLLPIVAWIMLVLTFIMTAIEAIAAAPLAIVMMCVPEGRGVAGMRLQTAIQLFTAIILTPTMLVIGLIAAIVLSFLGFAAMNLLVWPVIQTFNHTLTGMIVSVIVYTTFAYQVCQWSIHTMHRLPSNIFEWFAAGGSRFGDGGETGKVMETVASSGSGGGQTLVSTAGRVPERTLTDYQARRAAEEKAKAKAARKAGKKRAQDPEGPGE